MARFMNIRLIKVCFFERILLFFINLSNFDQPLQPKSYLSYENKGQI